MSLDDFQDNRPELDLFGYFEGRTEAWGMFQDRFGKVRRQFHVTIDGTVDGNMLTLDERFRYSDGGTDRRVWRIERLAGNRFQGTAGDVVGLAEGRIAGNAMNWRYQMDLKVGDGTWRVTFDDWLFLQTGGVIINRANITKWGLEIGQVTLFFRRPAAAGKAA